eukprot:3918167-Amphidinium_carterae.2
MDEFRHVLAKVTGTVLNPINNPRSAVRHDLLSGLARCLHDPGDDATQRHVDAALVGIMRDFQLDRIFDDTA